jgi:hypothetical protein
MIKMGIEKRDIYYVDPCGRIYSNIMNQCICDYNEIKELELAIKESKKIIKSKDSQTN